MNAALKAARATEKAARAKSLLEVTAFWNKKATQKKMIEGLWRSLAWELSARKRSNEEKRRTKDTAAANNKLNKQAKQLFARVAELEGEVVQGIETMADPNFELKVTEKWAEDVAYEKECPQSCL